MLLLLFMFVWFKAWDVEFIIISGYHEHDMLCNRIINDFGPLLTLYMQSTRTKLKLLLFYLRARVLLVTNQYSHCLRVYCASRSYFVKVKVKEQVYTYSRIYLFLRLIINISSALRHCLRRKRNWRAAIIIGRNLLAARKDYSIFTTFVMFTYIVRPSRAEQCRRSTAQIGTNLAARYALRASMFPIVLPPSRCCASIGFARGL